ncbi:MAG: Sua5/YciO/YrdC/YwlC family protein, partial [Alphaproteobacteria bacterium]|nr:Sua5/YciO/YrdC/YwlC family protein [Alphaproteobacteria bacterium]
GSLGIRIPDHSEASALLKQWGKPLVATSINLSGQPPLNDPEAICKTFPTVETVFSSAYPLSKQASTVIDLTTDTLKMVREGNLSFDTLISVLGRAAPGE